MAISQVIAFVVFFFALGACVGSFLNVVIWRLPNIGREVLFLNRRGALTLNWPPSHCPTCDAPIQWYQNIPMLSYMFLKGRCANCRGHIPIRYPLVELSLGVLFAAYFLALFVGQWQPYFTDVREPHQAAAFGLQLIFIAALLAASAIDADLFIIPLSIPWFLIVVGILASAFIKSPAMWALSPDYWNWAKPILGGAMGLGIANLLLVTGVMPRSFSEMQAEEVEEKKEEALAPPPKFTRFWPSVIGSVALVVVCGVAWVVVSPKAATLIAVAAGILIFLIGVLPRDEGQKDVTDEVLEEISDPHVRREVLKEVPFIAVPVICAAIAWFIPVEVPQAEWLGRVLGSLLGVLVGGGVVWVVRIGGTLLFNKEAMGMGDAHLMAGVGAVMGAPLTVLSFFVAPFLGILWAIVLLVMGKPNVLPYGPWLSISAILCRLIGNSLLAWYLAKLLPPLPPG